MRQRDEFIVISRAFRSRNELKNSRGRNRELVSIQHGLGKIGRAVLWFCALHRPWSTSNLPWVEVFFRRERGCFIRLCQCIKMPPLGFGELALSGFTRIARQERSV